MAEPRLFIRHLRQSRTCMKNSRAWFALHGWSWSDFRENGRPVADFIAVGDPLAQPAIDAALWEAEHGRG